jgi:hypothetical protein
MAGPLLLGGWPGLGKSSALVRLVVRAALTESDDRE